MSHRRLLPTGVVLIVLPWISGWQGTLPALGSTASDIDPALPIVHPDAAGRAATWENRTAAPGAGGMSDSNLGKGRKGSPCIPEVKNGETATLMDFEGCGVIRHIWVTIPDRSPQAMRNMILRMYWDNSPVPSVEVPLGDFFGVSHGRCRVLTSYYVTEILGRGFNCYFPMPFAEHARATVTNDMPDGKKLGAFFYQIDFESRKELPPDTGRFHAQFRRENPTVLKKDYVILDNVEGPGYFAGCVIGVRALGPHWWGEGEMKFYIDGDTDYPTICGTGTEDYFGAAWGMEEYQTPYAGCPLQLTNDFFKNPLVSLYRFHAKDPVYFRKSLKATMQQIGYHQGLFERSDDWSSVAYWYQLHPVKQMPPLPDQAARTADIIGPDEPKGGPKREAKFVLLFDGKDLNGWIRLTESGKEVAPADSAFSVVDGTIRCSGKGKDYWLAYNKEKYGDCVLRVDYKIAKGCNSGIFLKSPGYDKPAFKGFEVQILDDLDQPPSKHTSGAIYDIFAPLANMSRPVGQWNHVEITCKGPLTTVILNGLKVVDADFSLMTEPVGKFDFPYAKMPATGYIGVQNHGGEVWFRNPQVKKLN